MIKIVIKITTISNNSNS